MTDWNFLLDETALGTVFPNEYSRFVRPIREGLVVFLEGLPASAQMEILTQQAALSPTASFSERLSRLARCCPALHKLGQTLARDQRLRRNCDCTCGDLNRFRRAFRTRRFEKPSSKNSAH